MKIITKFYELIIILIFINVSFTQYYHNNNDYYSSSTEEIKEDEFISGNISNNLSKYYIFHILNDSEQIFFDFQSLYGCLNISIDDEKEIYPNISNNNIQFCSEGINNIFNINKNEILEMIENNKTESDSIVNLSIIIEVGYSYLETDQNLNFDYTLKISLRKPDINIFKIKSNHKILCKTEKIERIEELKYRCFFMIINNNNEQNDKNLILYSISQNKLFKLNIYADYINKEYYDEWKTEDLYENIPNINSTYNNYNKEMDYIIIPNIQNNQYIYISIESNNETTIELIPKILNNESSQMPQINDIQMYSINNNINFDFNSLPINEISLYIVTLCGKGKIHFEYDQTTQYITDIRENKILLNINLESCKKNNNCKIIVSKLEENDIKELDYIFYIYYVNNYNNILKELSYGKSTKLLYNNVQNPILLYNQIPNVDFPLNINLQLYNISDILTADYYNIEIRILSKNDIYQIKLNYNNINKYERKIEKKFNSILLSANIYLTSEEMKSFNVNEDPWLIIYISNEQHFENFILGSTISEVNSLIYPSERIYHFGQFNNEEKIVYKLKGNTNYHLMRLEFGCNSNYIGWSVKRNMDNDTYIKNDTDLSFVTEKWINGRQLLTMYIENGEDIYLTVFIKKQLDNKKLSNHIFKYINSGKNGDFKNYMIKKDYLNYDNDNKRIIINKLTNIPSSSKISYYLKIIKEEDYIENESLNTIAITESNSDLEVKGENNNNNIIFSLKEIININTTYYINAYSIINENNNDIEFISYSGFKINKINLKYRESNIKLVISSISIAGATIFILFISCICYCRKKRRRYSYDSHDDDLILDYLRDSIDLID